MRTCAALAAAVIFAAMAVLHAYWAVGGLWPGRDNESLAQIVVGSAPGTRAPGPGPCWLVAACLAATAFTVLGTSGLLPIPVPPAWLRWAAWAGAIALSLRGLAGFAVALMQPTRTSPFARLDVILYSPLCLLLSFLTIVAAEYR